jgi:hypothetical protein
MIVRAPNLAFGDLCAQAREVTASDKPGNLLCFQRRIFVVEIENDRIGFAAVHAWMSQQVVVGEELASVAIPQAPLTCLLQVNGPVQPIVLASVGATTLSAIAP